MTKAQAKVFEAVERWWERNNYAPSLQEIAALAGVSSISTVHVHIQKLIEQGKLRHGSTYGRNVEVVPERTCPTCGQAIHGSV